MDFAPFAVLALLNKWVMDWVRSVLPDTLETKILIPISGVVGVALSFIFANSAFGDGIDVWDGKNLGALDIFGVVIFGLAIAAGAGVLYNLIERRNPDS